MGFDIRDYEKILDLYCTIEDWQRLLDDLHSRNMGMIMDLVVNNTSSEGRLGHSMNAVSNIGNLHLFAINQPELNWDNPSVREAIHNMMRFWLEKGIDGFRPDVINMISKVYQTLRFPRRTPRPNLAEPNIHQYLKAMHNGVLKDYGDVMTIGEMPGDLDPYEASKEKEKHRSEKDIMYPIYKKGRDNARTPMQWSASANAGFTNDGVEPWLKVTDDYREWNVDEQLKDPDSVLSNYSRMIYLRKTHPQFFYGSFTAVDEDNEKIFALYYEWTVPDDIYLGGAVLMVGNYEVKEGAVHQTIPLQALEASAYVVLC
ncbi:hypothetical protein MMC30_003101 [Trapelia coarctata]|nr:hypothetical protein [Trapelia coarctata]